MAHAVLSPSGAYRWFECPGSIAATQHVPDNSNVYAREGTAAHTLGERCLKTGSDTSKWIGTHVGRIRVDYTEGGEAKCQFFEVDNEMANAVQIYIDYCRTIGSQPYAHVLIEQQVSLAPLGKVFEDVWGTSDCTIYTPEDKTLWVIDYKHGAGKVVYADDNKQLKIYGLAAWVTFAEKFKPERIVTVIVQPRAGGDPIRSATYTAAELMDFASDVEEAILRVQEPNAPLRPGSWCDFCKINTMCSALTNHALEVAQDEFAGVPAAQIPLDEAIRILEQVEPLEVWIKQLRQHMHAKAMAGDPIPGYKLVPMRGRRQFVVKDEEVVDTLTMLSDVNPDDLFEPRALKSPAQIEKVVGKAKFPQGLVQHVSSGYNLVKDVDARIGVDMHPGADFMDDPIQATLLSIEDI